MAVVPSVVLSDKSIPKAETLRPGFWWIGIVAATLSAVFSSATYPLAEEALRHFPIVGYIAVRSGIVSIIYLCAVFNPVRSLRPGPIELSQLRRHRAELLQIVFLRGVIGELIICAVLTLSVSIKVMFLTKMEPYIILLFGWLAGTERLSRAQSILLATHIGGAVLLATGGTISMDITARGDVLLIVFLVITSWVYRHYSNLSRSVGSIHVNGLRSIGSFVIMFPLAWALGELPELHFGNPGWRYLIGVVILLDILASVLYFESLRDLPSWLASALRALGPVFAAPIAFLFFGQSLGLAQIFGAIVIVATSFLLTLERRQLAKQGK